MNFIDFSLIVFISINLRRRSVVKLFMNVVVLIHACTTKYNMNLAGGVFREKREKRIIKCIYKYKVK